jgi:hypothetical protein
MNVDAFGRLEGRKIENPAGLSRLFVTREASH